MQFSPRWNRVFGLGRLLVARACGSVTYNATKIRWIPKPLGFPSVARKDISMTDGEVLAFLSDGRKTLQVASNDPDGYPHLAPMWFVVEDGKIVFRSFSKSQKILNLERDPKVTVLVEEGNDYSELQGVMIKGNAKLVNDADYCLDLYVALASRYPYFPGVEPGTTPEPEVRQFFAGHAAKQTAVIVEPVEIASWDYRKLGGGY